MQTDYTYKKGDTVVYVGIVYSDKNKIQQKLNLGTVIEAGVYELIIEPLGNYFNQHLKVRKNLCVLVNLENINHEKPKAP